MKMSASSWRAASDPLVYNFQEGGLGFVGVPSLIGTPSLLSSDVDIRRSVGKHKRPPVYPRPPVVDTK